MKNHKKQGTGENACSLFMLLAVLALILVIVLLAAVLVVVLLTVLLGILRLFVVLIVLVIILVAHGSSLLIDWFGTAAIVCADVQDLSLGSNKSAARTPKITAAVIPPAAAFSPPVNTPRSPS